MNATLADVRSAILLQGLIDRYLSPKLTELPNRLFSDRERTARLTRCERSGTFCTFILRNFYEQ